MKQTTVREINTVNLFQVFCIRNHDPMVDWVRSFNPYYFSVETTMTVNHGFEYFCSAYEKNHYPPFSIPYFFKVLRRQ